MLLTIRKIIIYSCMLLLCLSAKGNGKIDRKAVVSRHNITMTKVEQFSPLSVGNGHFCHTVDLTGMQTFPELYRKGIPLTTMSEWGWHSLPNIKKYHLSEVFKYLDTYGKQVPYPIEKSPGYEFLRSNPHQSCLALIGLQKTDGETLKSTDVTDTHQFLNLWQGLLKSDFKISNSKVEVQTICHPIADRLAYSLKSSLFSTSKLGIRILFPYTSVGFGKDPAVFGKDGLHNSAVVYYGNNEWIIKHEMDDFFYYCHIEVSVKSELKQTARHEYLVVPVSGDNAFSVMIDFTKDKSQFIDDSFHETVRANKKSWKRFWNSGGAVDLSGSKDVRWKELERRIVLSQYVTAIQSRQKYPPQETGLTCNSWYGKFHLEMHWWHSVHFALWGRSSYLSKTLNWYKDIFKVAESYTKVQGYKGVRWPKMVGPDGIDAPSATGPLLIWQQPHIIYYSELLYRENPTSTILNEYGELIESTAEFMFDYAHWNASRKCYVLGPPVISAREGNTPTYLDNINPAFELAYWSWGLRKANDWRERLGKKRNKEWDNMADKMAPWPVENGIFIEAESVKEKDGGHPTQLAAYGFLPETKSFDKNVMRKTLHHVMEAWPWESTWGWDYPLIAMTAVRLNEPEVAIEALLKDVQKNTYLPNGHNYQSVGLPLYLPGNGGLLTVISMMCAGWDGSPDIHAPGFPQDGNWNVKWEGLKPIL